MKRISNHSMGIDQGDVILFSDFEDGGEMWTGKGLRERRKPVIFKEKFRGSPVVQVSVSLWDIGAGSAVRAEVVAENTTPAGFDIVFRTWSDTRVARIRVTWTAFGELPHEDDWELY